MNKKILIGSIIAVAILVLVSLTSAVIDNSSRGEEYIYYYNPDTFGYWIWPGCQDPPCYWITAIRLTQDELSGYSGWNLTKVKVRVCCDCGQYEFYARLIIYGEGTPTHPGGIIYEKPDLYFDVTGFHTIEVDEPIALDDHEEIWVAIRWEITEYPTFPVFVDEGPAVPGKGDWINCDGSNWHELRDSGIDYNLYIGAIVEGEGKAELSIVNIIGPIGVNAGVRNIGEMAAVNLEYEMTITGGILGLVNRTVNDTKTTLNPGATVPISSGFLLGFGPITIEITVDADNAYKVTTTKTGFMFGPFVFGIK